MVLAASPAQAALQDDQFWFQTNANVPLADKLRVTMEQIARFGDRPSGLYQTEYGALFSYKVAKNIELGFGYRRVGFHNRNTSPDEDRVRQQVIATFGPIFTRFRIDERFYPGSDEIGISIRPQIRFNQKIGTHGFGLFASHESFYQPNRTRWGQRRGYDRMRNLVGASIPVGRGVSADLGYLNQFRPSHGSSRAQMDHALSLQVTINVNRTR